MTVGELIAALGEFDPNTRVVVTGYEAGYNDPRPPVVVMATLDANDKDRWYMGKHAEEEREQGPAVGVVLIGR